MSLLSTARASMDTADYVIAVMVEQIRASHGSAGVANAVTVASQINGAPRDRVADKLRRLKTLGVLSVTNEFGDLSYCLTPLGVELLSAEVENFTQSRREETRRARELAVMLRGA